MFFITTFCKLEKHKLGWWNLGGQRTVGYVETLEEARDIVTNNWGDLCETIYEYALIEEVPAGLYPRPKTVELYRVKDITKNIDGVDYYNPDLTYERIQHPESFDYSALAMG